MDKESVRELSDLQSRLKLATTPEERKRALQLLLSKVDAVVELDGDSSLTMTLDDIAGDCGEQPVSTPSSTSEALQSAGRDTASYLSQPLPAPTPRRPPSAAVVRKAIARVQYLEQRNDRLERRFTLLQWAFASAMIVAVAIGLKDWIVL